MYNYFVYNHKNNEKFRFDNKINSIKWTLDHIISNIEDQECRTRHSNELSHHFS